MLGILMAAHAGGAAGSLLVSILLALVIAVVAALVLQWLGAPQPLVLLVAVLVFLLVFFGL